MAGLFAKPWICATSGVQAYQGGGDLHACLSPGEEVRRFSVNFVSYPRTLFAYKGVSCTFGWVFRWRQALRVRSFPVVYCPPLAVVWSSEEPKRVLRWQSVHSITAPRIAAALGRSDDSRGRSKSKSGRTTIFRSE